MRSPSSQDVGGGKVRPGTMSLELRDLLLLPIVLAASCDGCRTETVFVQKNVIDEDRARLRAHAVGSDEDSPETCAKVPGTLTSAYDPRDDRGFLVLFFATWSAPDKPMIEAVEAEVARDAHRWRYFKSEIDAQPRSARACNIESVPTLVAFVHGQPVNQIVGAVPRKRLREFLDSLPGLPRTVGTVAVEGLTPAVSDGHLVEDIGIETLGGVFTPLLSRGLRAPCRKTETFSTATDNQTAVPIRLFRRKGQLAGETTALGAVTVEDLPKRPRGTVNVDVTFAVTSDRSIVVSAKERSGHPIQLRRHEDEPR